jgi:hypothetical protein
MPQSRGETEARRKANLRPCVSESLRYEAFGSWTTAITHKQAWEMLQEVQKRILPRS